MDMIEKLEMDFIKEDRSERFLDREYVREIKRIFKLLKGTIPSDVDATDKAIYDIVEDIKWYFKKRKAHISGYHVPV